MHFESVVLVAEEARDAAVEAAVDIAAQLHERKHAVLVAPFLGDHRAVAGERHRRVELVPGHHQVVGGPVTAILGVVAANDAELVSLLGEERQMLGDADAGQRGRNRSEFAANLCGCIRFGIERVVMARAALHPKQDAAFRFFCSCSRRGSQVLQTQEPWQREAERRQSADTNELAPRNIAAIGRDSGDEIKHDRHAPHEAGRWREAGG